MHPGHTPSQIVLPARVWPYFELTSAPLCGTLSATRFAATFVLASFDRDSDTLRSSEMSHLPLPPSPELNLPRRTPFVSEPSAGLEPSQQANSTALLAVLRDALASGHHPVDAIFRAVADTARLLTGANGTAIALRTNDVVVCRARSGEIAPAIGALLNVDSGISGECFRTSRTLRCDDTQTDARVEPEVCRLLGIRSIAAIPLRGALGTFGILEAFSNHSYAFTHEQFSSLKSLGEIAEAAYRQAGSPTPLTPAQASTVVSPSDALIASPAHKEKPSPAIPSQPAPKTTRRNWIMGGAAALMLLACAIVWWTWREPVGESTAGLPRAQADTARVETSNVIATTRTSAKPSATITNEEHDRSLTKGVVRNAANIEAVEDSHLIRPPSTLTKNIVVPASSGDSSPRSSASTTVVEPPVVVASTPENSYKLADIISAPAPLPGLAVRISQGVTEPGIIRQVPPIYPPEALKLRVEGSVTLEALVAEDGTIRGIKVLRGRPLLAAAAVAAVRQWRYTPSLLDGKPTPVEKEITIKFTLR